MARKGEFKYDINDMQTLANKRGGKCLSKTFKGINKKIKWECRRGHRWSALAQSAINDGNWCQQCVNIEQTKTIDDMYKLASEKGFKCLSKTYSRSNITLKWECSKGHTWKAVPESISRYKCPCCRGMHRTIDFLTSLAKNRNGKCISINFKTMSDKYVWQCNKGHQWKASASCVFGGSWCPVCAGQSPPTKSELEQLAILRGGKFIDSVRYINKFTKLAWQCKHKHIWYAPKRSIKRGTWCPHCQENRREKECRNIFQKLTGKQFIKTRTILSGNLELDGYCDELKLAFEYNGIQHYNTVPYLKVDEDRLKRIQSRDAKKIQLCKKRNIHLIVIPYKTRNLELFIRKLLVMA